MESLLSSPQCVGAVSAAMPHSKRTVTLHGGKYSSLGENKMLRAPNHPGMKGRSV